MSNPLGDTAQDPPANSRASVTSDNDKVYLILRNIVSYTLGSLPDNDF